MIGQQLDGHAGSTFEEWYSTLPTEDEARAFAERNGGELTSYPVGFSHFVFTGRLALDPLSRWCRRDPARLSAETALYVTRADAGDRAIHMALDRGVWP